MDNAKEKFSELEAEEKDLVFRKFTYDDALNLGLIIKEKSADYPAPVAIEITVNGLVVFRLFTEGSIPDSELWLMRKRNSVELMRMSSLRFMYWLELFGTDVKGRLLDVNSYVAGGGGFPLSVKNTGVIGSICVSGLPDHLDDHRLIVDSVREYISVQGG